VTSKQIGGFADQSRKWTLKDEEIPPQILKISSDREIEGNEGRNNETRGEAASNEGGNCRKSKVGVCEICPISKKRGGNVKAEEERYESMGWGNLAVKRTIVGTVSWNADMRPLGLSEKRRRRKKRLGRSVGGGKSMVSASRPYYEEKKRKQ